ncbi:hypothetical protein KUA55_16485 [Enterococcus sp. ALS3]|uniref:Uncharacterized protein n=1 Tax=Enterococcus alishanensis TaxID=1303817 RepID=A0ABS6TH39_9ENTE|nr:hypothetical protein [Enterococcus alishanensis]MBV7392282.1 hypothetical protein [Enterococcus alishanensis]
MWNKVIREKTVHNTILRNGLRLLHQKGACQNTDKTVLLEISEHLQNVMQLHLETKNLVIGIPGFGKEVMLLETDVQEFVPHYKIEQMIESAEGHFIRLKPLKTI